jgi:hypothetical protein
MVAGVGTLAVTEGSAERFRIIPEGEVQHMTKTLKGTQSTHTRTERMKARNRRPMGLRTPTTASAKVDVPVGSDITVTVTVRGPDYRAVTEAVKETVKSLASLRTPKEGVHESSERIDRRPKASDKEVEFRKKMIKRLECLKSSDVGRILYPTSKEARSSVAKRRESGELIGLKTSRDYNYPKFQFDTSMNRIHDVVAYANSVMGADTDPWGVADWWGTPSAVLGEQTPLEAFGAGALDRDAVDRIWKYEME